MAGFAVRVALDGVRFFRVTNAGEYAANSSIRPQLALNFRAQFGLARSGRCAVVFWVCVDLADHTLSSRSPVARPANQLDIGYTHTLCAPSPGSARVGRSAFLQLGVPDRD